MTIKETPINEIPSDTISDYLVNKTKGTAIKIPKSVLTTIRTKLRSNSDFLDESILDANIISVALQLREHNRNNVGFSKFLRHALTKSNVSKLLKGSEVDDLVDFFFKVPLGYKFNDGNRIWAHSEIGDLTS